MMSFRDTSLEQLRNKVKLNVCDVEQVWNKNWIVACSGGADSILALNILVGIHKIHPVPGRKLIIYFLDHGDQDIENTNKRNLLILSNINEIKKSFTDLNLVYLPYYRDMNKICHKIKGNFEFTSSRIRYKHLKQAYIKNQGSVIVTGHNMSDWMETIVMRMNRGTSIENIYPFLPNEIIQGIHYFRPLILLSSEEIRSICIDHFFKFWNDPSNFTGSNTRSKIRKNFSIVNPDGFRLTTQNFIKSKLQYIHSINFIRDQMIKNIYTISHGHEYRIEWSFFLNLDIEYKKYLFEIILKDLSLWPISFNLKNSLNTIPFRYKYWFIEKENWSNKIYIIFRKGRNRLLNIKSTQYNINLYSTIKSSTITKKYFIKLSFGKKIVKKILSEKQLSNRQKQSLDLVINKKNHLEIMYIPLSCFGLKDITSIDFITT
ncbi:MAG: tRNA lysidine(34) synthetase TilS [Spirochaetia bacterium]|nr:tRNA lysidine(34) synthetase TilS [Spirochaetia bacterium]